MDEHQRLACAAEKLVKSILAEWSGDLPTALNTIADILDRCGNDPDWCMAELRGALLVESARR